MADFLIQNFQNGYHQCGKQNKQFEYGDRKEKVVLEEYIKLNESLAMYNHFRYCRKRPLSSNYLKFNAPFDGGSYNVLPVKKQNFKNTNKASPLRS